MCATHSIWRSYAREREREREEAAGEQMNTCNKLLENKVTTAESKTESPKPATSIGYGKWQTKQAAFKLNAWVGCQAEAEEDEEVAEAIPRTSHTSHSPLSKYKHSLRLRRADSQLQLHLHLHLQLRLCLRQTQQLRPLLLPSFYLFPFLSLFCHLICIYFSQPVCRIPFKFPDFC